MFKTTIQTVHHNKQRYNTLGDWYKKGSSNIISVSKLDNWKFESLIALHELVEMILCQSEGITQEAVDKFDKEFSGLGEPGDDPNCPYRKQHAVAEAVEKLVAAYLLTPEENKEYWYQTTG